MTKAVGVGSERRSSKLIKMEPVPLDGGYGWVVVLGSFFIHVFADGFLFSFGVIADALIREFNSTNAYVSIILSLLIGLMLGTGCIASVMCHRYGCRITTILGALIAAGGCSATYYASSMQYTMVSVGIVMGIGIGFMYCAAIIIVTLYFEERRSLATGITVCGAGVGTFMFSMIIGHLIDAFGWRIVFLIYAGILLLCVPCGMLFKPVKMRIVADETIRPNVGNEWRKSSIMSNRIFADKIQPRIPTTQEIVESDSDSQSDPPKTMLFHAVTLSSFSKAFLGDKKEGDEKTGCLEKIVDLSLIRDPVFWLFGISIFLGMAGYDAPPMFMPLNARVVLGMDHSDASNTVAAYGFANTIGRIGFGFLCDLRLPSWMGGIGQNCAQNRLVIYSLAMMLCGLSSATVMLFHTTEWFMGYCIFFGFSISSFMCLWSVILADLVGYCRLTNAFSMLLFVQGIATFIGTPISGQLFDITQKYEMTFVFCGLMQFLSGLVMLCIVPTQYFRRRKQRLSNTVAPLSEH